MGITFKQRKIRESHFFVQEKKRRLIIEKDYPLRFETVDALNQFMSELNEKRFQSEIQMEKELKKLKIRAHFRFWKNYPYINTFFIDFYCPDHKLAIEVDGGCHKSEKAFKKDAYRDSLLKKAGIQVFRIKFPGFEGLSSLKEKLFSLENESFNSLFK